MTDEISRRLRTVVGRDIAPTMNEAADTIDALRAERDALRKAVDDMNITTLIAHALEDGHINEAVAELFDDALNEQIAALAALKGEK